MKGKKWNKQFFSLEWETLSMQLCLRKAEKKTKTNQDSDCCFLPGVPNHCVEVVAWPCPRGRKLIHPSSSGCWNVLTLCLFWFKGWKYSIGTAPECLIPLELLYFSGGCKGHVLLGCIITYFMGFWAEAPIDLHSQVLQGYSCNLLTGGYYKPPYDLHLTSPTPSLLFLVLSLQLVPCLPVLIVGK